MRRASFAAAIVGVCVAMAPLAHGAGVHETFNASLPIDANWYYMLNDNPTAVLAPTTDLGGGDRAAFIPVNSFLYTVLGQSAAVPSTLYFETASISPALTADSFRSAVAVVGQGSPASSVSSIGYYLYVDTLLADGVTPGQDGDADSYYLSTLALAGSPGVLQNYETRSLTDGTDTWARYDWNIGLGDWAFGANVTSVATAITDETIYLGLQFDLAPLVGGPDYLTIYVDDVFVPVPEPSALLLACFGVVGILARRSRRQEA